VDPRLGELGRVTVRPEREERVGLLERAACVAVVVLAVRSDLHDRAPGLPKARAAPQHHLATGLIGLGPGPGRPVHQPLLTVEVQAARVVVVIRGGDLGGLPRRAVPSRQLPGAWIATRAGDRKSTRLNSSHVSISYAVFCL